MADTNSMIASQVSTKSKKEKKAKKENTAKVNIESATYYIQNTITKGILGRLLDGKGEEDIEFYKPTSTTFINRKKYNSIKKIYDFLIEKGFENIEIKHEKTLEDIITKLTIEFGDKKEYEKRYGSKQKNWTEEEKQQHKEELAKRGKGPVDGDERILYDDYFSQPEYDPKLDVPVYTDDFNKYLKYMNKKRKGMSMNNTEYYTFIMNNQCDFCSRRCKMCHAETMTTFYECNRFSFNSLEINEIEEENTSVWDILRSL